MHVKYCGPAHDYSGYGEATRHDIGALHVAGVGVTTQIPKYVMEVSNFGRLGELASDLQQSQGDYKVKIIHTTPNVYRQFMEVGKYHIGRVFWETDRLPQDFSQNVQLMDEIWTGSEFNREAIKRSGVTKPIYIIPEAIDINIPDFEPYITAVKDMFTFYSIFEWTQRKNPGALLEAFWKEFENTNGVSLVIKTYLDNFTPEKFAEIFQFARSIKRKLQLKKYAPVFICSKFMDRYQVYRFHKSFDCFVSAHRGEGWGIPQMEALLLKKPLISTNCGGIHEYLHNTTDALLPSFSMVPLRGNNRNPQWYASDQNWADINIADLQEKMRWVFDQKDRAREMGITGGKLVEKTFSLEAVGRLMIERLQQIYG